MKILVAGGRLQGVEATYLAQEAGWEVSLIDRDDSAPAVGLCDSFHHLDIMQDGPGLERAVRGASLVIPALEDLEALDLLERVAGEAGVPIAYDPGAYRVSSSKIRSDQLFAEYGIAAPTKGSREFPLVVKPSSSSGSEGVRRLNSLGEYRAFEKEMGGDLSGWVIQEFLEGPSYSLEVVGTGEEYRALQVTKLEMDDAYDCKRVLAPADLPPDLVRDLEDATLKVAKVLKLKGVMDIEVILNRGSLKVLEIDARLPSQTPTAVYMSSCQNLLEWMAQVFMKGDIPKAEIHPSRAVIYEHLWAHDGVLEVLGEHVMTGAGPLQHKRGFFGADEALTNFQTRDKPWVATLITTGKTPDEAGRRRQGVIGDMMTHCGLFQMVDTGPEQAMPGGSH